MEAIGLVASVSQITTYAFSILETMQKIRALARDGPDQLQEKVQHLDILLRIVGRIEGNQGLRDEAIALYLASIQKKIRRLLEAVKVNLSKLGARTFKGLLAAVRIISTEKLFDASFAAISQDCSTLTLHIMSSKEESRDMGQIPILSPLTRPDSLRGTGAHRRSDENRQLVPRQPPNQRLPAAVHHDSRVSRYNDDSDSSTGGGHEKNRGPQGTPIPVMHTIKQVFGNISSSGKGSENRVGNHGGDQRSLDQTAGDINVTDGAKLSVGNTDEGEGKK